MPRIKKYTDEELRASNIYAGIQSRTKKASIENHSKIKPIKETWNNKNDFIEWYLSNEKKGCYYCKTSLNHLYQFYVLTKKENKRSEQRGKSLEVDKVNPKDVNYSKKNCVLACYWCNNAKTDVFNEQDMNILGPAINKTIISRIKENILLQLKKNNAFDTLAWSERNKKEKDLFAEKIINLFPKEIIQNILKTSRSQQEESSFISLDSGEIYVYLKQELKINFLINVDLNKLPPAEHIIVFFKTNNPLDKNYFINKLENLKSKNWTYATIQSKKESVDVIIFENERSKN